MVFFSCDGCGEMLKKNQVDGHANRCRRCDAVSCVDCSVSFYGDDYRAHTSCISEAERYEGKSFKPAKRNPQQEWTDAVATCADNAPPHLKNYMRTMAGLDNIPRKEKQFRNFTTNSLNLRGKNESIVGEIWDLLKAEREKRQKARELQEEERKRKEEAAKAEKAKEKEATVDTGDSSKTEENQSKGESSSVDTKTIQKALKKTLKKAPNKTMKMKELRKVLGEKLSLPKSGKKILKELLLNTPEGTLKSKIKIDGKLVSLV